MFIQMVLSLLLIISWFSTPFHFESYHAGNLMRLIPLSWSTGIGDAINSSIVVIESIHLLRKVLNCAVVSTLEKPKTSVASSTMSLKFASKGSGYIRVCPVQTVVERIVFGKCVLLYISG